VKGKHVRVDRDGFLPPPTRLNQLHSICVVDEPWSPSLREEHRLGVFENRVLRRISVPKRDEVTGGKSSSGIWCRLVMVRTDVSEERIASIFRAGESRREYSEQVANTPQYCSPYNRFSKRTH
jgi:hypothetical protein